MLCGREMKGINQDCVCTYSTKNKSAKCGDPGLQFKCITFPPVSENIAQI